MKIKIFFLIAGVILYGYELQANGVVFNKAEKESYLKLQKSVTNVSIESQVATTVTTQLFMNNIDDSLSIKYAFPLPENASATKLRYKINNTWYTATFSAVPQDTSTGGSSSGGVTDEDKNLKEYLGVNPLYFNIVQTLQIESNIEMELTYVELLPYKFGKVNYTFPNDYNIIQTEKLEKQELNLLLKSERAIDDIYMLSHSATSLLNSGNEANLNFVSNNQKASSDYEIQYSLSLNELGLYSLSTFIDDTLKNDEFGRGFFAFIVEPDASETTDVIDKVFTLIIDRSGSMSGDKIIQARNAAQFIVENLNEGDKFNIVTFDSYVKSFRSSHIEYNLENEIAALNYIQAIEVGGSTNISGAFDTAIPQFSSASSNTANIIIFFTDGEQTAGITDTDKLIEHIDDLVNRSEKQISIFTFGIGESTNTRLLTSIASNNNGTAEFLANNELEEVLTDFYLMIRNPVLLSTQIEFSPAIINEIYPTILPNLYKGQQMILVGRYSEPLNLSVKIKGKAFSKDVEYNYNTGLSDSMKNEYQFLTKLWAKSKIEDLVDKYYVNHGNSSLTNDIRQEIINVSLTYGVISPFTSFYYNDIPDAGVVDTTSASSTGGFDYYATEIEYEEIGQNERIELSNEYLEVISISPNPCSDFLNIVIDSKDVENGNIEFKLLDAQSKLMYSKSEYIFGNLVNAYRININNLNLASGVYVLMIEYKGETIVSKVYVY